MRHPPPPSATCALSERLDTREAAQDALEQLQRGLRSRPSVVFVFGSFHHRAWFSDAAAFLREELRAGLVLGATVASAIGDGREVDGGAGLAALALSAPEAAFRPFAFTLDDGPPSVWPEALVRERVALGGDVSDPRRVLPHRGLILLTDPFTMPGGQACAAIDAAAGPAGGRIHGGVVSGASHAGMNVLVADRHVASTGLVGLSVFGELAIDGILSPGSRGLGAPAVVTRAFGTKILEIGGRPAYSVAQEVLESLPDAERQRVVDGIHVGIAANAAKPRLVGRDFLARRIVSFDPRRGTIDVGEPVPVGSTIRFEARDARTAREDLALALSVEALRAPAAGALLLSGSGRDARFFDEADHDATALARALGGAPVAGFRSTGEFGGVDGRTQLQLHSASCIVFRRSR